MPSVKWMIAKDKMGYHTKVNEPQPDNVNHPAHYKGNGLESIQVIEAFDLNFHLGNAIKYILRAEKKNNKIEDLEKAIWYLKREISRSQNLNG